MKYLIFTSMILASSFCFSITKDEKEDLTKHFIEEYRKCFEKQHYNEKNQEDFFYYLGCCHAYHEMINFVQKMPVDKY